jgi:hypothetical protein
VLFSRPELTDVCNDLRGFTMLQLRGVETLHAILQASRKRNLLPSDRAEHLALSLAECVERLHTHPWQFRFGDLTTNNIMVEDTTGNIHFVNSDSFQYSYPHPGTGQSHQFLIHGLSAGTPHIFHLTDGVPTDATIGKPEWTEFLEIIQTFTGPSAAEQGQKGNIVHFVSPSGCVIGPYNYQTDTDGTKLSGEDILKRLAGPVPVVKLTRGPDSLKAALKLVTTIVTTVSALGARKSTAQIVNEAIRENAGTLDSSPGLPPTGLPDGTSA